MSFLANASGTNTMTSNYLSTDVSTTFLSESTQEITDLDVTLISKSNVGGLLEDYSYCSSGTGSSLAILLGEEQGLTTVDYFINSGVTGS
jgi:hypothetical protein